MTTTVNDASVLRIVEQVDGVEVDRTPVPEPPPVEQSAAQPDQTPPAAATKKEKKP